MRVVHLCTTDNSGGAARAAYRLHKGLISRGVESFMFVRDRLTDDPRVIKYRKPAGTPALLNTIRRRFLNSELDRYSDSRPRGMEVFSDDRSSLKHGFLGQLPETDIYHLHWVSGYLDLPSFLRQTGKPVVWTLHDMFPFTGGCHYNSGCEKYYSSCGACPQLGSSSAHDLASRIWKRKNEVFQTFKDRLVFRADSYWLALEARKSGLLKGMDIDTIHYGIETELFSPADKSACRKALNIPEGSRVIAFGAPGIDNPRKGFVQLMGALSIVKEAHKNIHLACFGSGTLPGLPDLPVLNFGPVTSNHLLSIIYNSADVFVIPSLQEAFGQTALEALSCGVPVAGFETGGIPDMVVNGSTGFLAKTGDTMELAAAINRVLDLDDRSYHEMSALCREKVLTGFALDLQAKKYLELYHKLLKD